MTISLLGNQARHLVSRFSYGVTPRLAAEVRAAGGARAWFARQLSPEGIADSGADGLDSWFPSLDRDAATLWRRQVEGIEGGWEVMQDYARWVLLRRMRSKRQVHEVMTEFWENHFNVPVNGDASFTHRKAYGDAIRAHALDSFEALLRATITHPAMLIYLDNAVSTAAHPNENLGRELLELHTVGRGNHDEDDVKSSARILTGWTVAMWSSWAPSYDTRRHWRGPVQVLGFSDPNASADGQDLTRRYLSYLAHHPMTARRIARKLAVKFVRDDPPDQLVEDLAQVYLSAGTQIRPVLKALVKHPVFAASVDAKVRDPGEDVVATYRALGVKVARPSLDQDAANSMLWQVSSLGTAPFAWPRPDGQPVDNDSWSSPSRVLASLRIHFAMSGTWWPRSGITYREPTGWAPQLPIRFDRLVDHLARTMLHRPASDALLASCCAAVGCRPGERITRDHPVMRWMNPRLLTTVLDSPDFFAR